MQTNALCERKSVAIARPMPVRPPVMHRTCGFVCWSKTGERGISARDFASSRRTGRVEVVLLNYD